MWALLFTKRSIQYVNRLMVMWRVLSAVRDLLDLCFKTASIFPKLESQ